MTIVVVCGCKCALVPAQLLCEEQKREIQELLSHLFRCEGFGYTFIGAKAVSLEGYVKHSFTCSSLEEGEILMHLQGRSSLSFTQTWDRLLSEQGQLNTAKFILLENEQDLFKDSRVVVFINKEKFIEEVEKNIHLFHKYLGSDISGEILLQRIQDRQASLMTSIRSHQGLLGILLGYGVYNSMLYHKRCQLLLQKRKMENLPIDPASRLAKTLQAKLAKVNSKLVGVNSYLPPPYSIQPVWCVGDLQSLETKALVKHYECAQKQLGEIFSRTNWLDVMLAKLFLPQS
jgi:hypothetical protein